MRQQLNKRGSIILIAGLLFNSCAAPTRVVSNKRPPNIIFVLTDDMGYGDIGCFNGQYQTPYIDQLAAEGTRYTQYYSASPICSPSRAGFLTGSNPARSNITSFLQTRKGNASCEQADYLTTAAPSVARLLKTHGYATGHFGKWHMGGGRDVDDAPSIREYGFDEYNSTWESPDPDPLITGSNWIWSDKDSIKRWDRTRYFVDRALAFMDKHRDQPCFVNIWPDDVHTPWVPGDESTGHEKGGQESLASFRAVLKTYDQQIGQLLEGLKRMGLAENTIVIFTSDNGPLPTFGHSRSAAMRGSKLSLYEGGIRLPFIVRWPGVLKAGAVDSTSVICGTDLLPTFCRIAGTPLPESVQVDGEDRSAVLRGAPAQRTSTIFWEYGRNDIGFKYPQGADRSPNLALREGKWKFLINADGSSPELYDLAADPNETRNVQGSQAELTATLSKKLLDWRKALPVLPAK
ncbi:MAG: sulfatase-like hydrolase/transferase [Candidatus Pseudobacter hemicellulosilyticus]|uniref:Sulfatase-like hydrolase/transferase n=1 Tax=Candidatus Pseudobacter hemicellulosilyticus TaxID=3121375 RepID=A0AAJ5WUF8_9BACT|nr:MAG: sulfatase-like hydrolase/transferase [Pseudobacter sp.]